ncbi:PDZ domain-containing protein [Aeoliella sp.]|uniref:PDZ domain-containing protein n=1 Tax=Aeoliella sp. TaxID=2795800 RepID=UPI003CCB79A4
MSRVVKNLLLVAVATVSLAASAQAQNRWQFGMSVQLTNVGWGKYLRVTSVTPYSPAAQAGLEPGDMIYSVNGQRFNNANNDWQALNILQQATTSGIGNPGIPTTMVATNPGTARMQVKDVRSGNFTQVVCYPRDNFGGGGGGGGIPTQIPGQPTQFVNPQVNPNPGFTPPGNWYPQPNPGCGGGGGYPVPPTNPGNPGCGGGGGNPGGGNPGGGGGGVPTTLRQGIQMFKQLTQ